MEKSKLFRTALKSIFISAMALLLIFTASACSNQKEISWKSAADSSVGFNVPDEYELKSDDDGQLYTMGKNEIYVCDDEEEFDVYSINEETAYLKDQLGGEYEVVQIPKGYEAAHTVSNENDLITHKYAIREKTTRSYGMYDFKCEETHYNYFLFRIVIDPTTTLIPEDEMLEQFWDRVIFNLYEDSEIVSIPSCDESEIGWKQYTVNEMEFQIPGSYFVSSESENRMTFHSNGNFIAVEYFPGARESQHGFGNSVESVSQESIVIPLKCTTLSPDYVTNANVTHYVLNMTTGDVSNQYTFNYGDGYYCVTISPKETSEIPGEELISQFWDRVDFSVAYSETVRPYDESQSETSQAIERDEVVEQFRTVLGSQEIDDNYGYTSSSESAQATMDYMEQDLLDLLRPMATGDWSNGQDGVYLALWGWIESSKQYYRSTAVEAYMNGETTYTIEQIREMIESNDNELDNLLSETWETLSVAISLEYEDGIQSFIDGVERA